jgi:hypothetical protein
MASGEVPELLLRYPRNFLALNFGDLKGIAVAITLETRGHGY